MRLSQGRTSCAKCRRDAKDTFAITLLRVGLDMLGNKQPQISVAKETASAVYYSGYQICTSGGWDSNIWLRDPGWWKIHSWHVAKSTQNESDPGYGGWPRKTDVLSFCSHFISQSICIAPPNHTGGLDLCSFQVLEWKEWVICPQPERPLRLEFSCWVFNWIVPPSVIFQLIILFWVYTEAIS